MSIHEDTLRVLEFDAWNRRLAAFAASDAGREAALVSRPAGDLETALRLLDETGEALSLLWAESLPRLGVQADGLDLLERAHADGSPLLARELATLLAFLRSVCDLRQRLVELETCPALSAIGQSIPALEPLLHSLQRAVDVQGLLLDSATPKLYQLRLELAESKESLRRHLERFANRKEVRPLLRSNHVSLRDGRFVLAVRAGARGQIRGIYHDRSQSGNTVYMEPEEVVDDQNRMHDLGIDEQREVIRILWGFTRELLARESELRRARAALARFDLASARAALARTLGLERPDLQPLGELALAGARHPLLLGLAHDQSEGAPEERLDLARRRTIPFDVRLGDLHDVLVLTGPNTGGKTVTLKAIGLLSLLPRAGHFLPAQSGARIPWFPGVFADVGDEQDLTQSLSTFSGHVRRIASMLKTAAPGALILLDELGSGTDPLEGEALSTALLDHLLEAGMLAVVTTHLGRLKEFAGRRPRAANASMEFDPESFRPTYRLVLGIPGASNALRIAAHLGLPGSILTNAERLLSRQGRQSAELFDQLDQARAAVERARGEAETDRRRAAEARTRSVEKEVRLDRARAALMVQAEAAAEDRLRRLLEELEVPRRALLALGGKGAAAAGQMLEAIRRAQGASPLSERRRQYVRSLRPGDRVFLPEYNEICEIRRILKKEERIEVSYRSLSLTVGFDEIAPVEQSHLHRPPETT